MTKLEELEKSIAALPKAQINQLADWFDDFSAAQWDSQIAINAEHLALNELADNALSAHRAGHTTGL